MNYLEFFELNQEPFSNAPVARFYYDSMQHRQALVRLKHAVENMKGLAVLVGDIGAGKTTLARRLLDSLPEEQYEAALLMIVHAETTAGWLLSRIALLLGVENPAEDKLRLLSQLYQRLVAIHQSGKKAVVLIDEAQMLRSREIMEEFRGLLNLELTERKLLSFVFFGLYELDQNLKLDEPLNNRVAMRVRLEPLNRDATAAYITHRLKLAGAKRPLLSEAAIDAVHRFSRGTPRLINTVCDNALLECFFLRQAIVEPPVVARVAEDLGLVANALPEPVAAAPAVRVGTTAPPLGGPAFVPAPAPSGPPPAPPMSRPAASRVAAPMASSSPAFASAPAPAPVAPPVPVAPPAPRLTMQFAPTPMPPPVVLAPAPVAPPPAPVAPARPAASAVSAAVAEVLDLSEELSDEAAVGAESELPEAVLADAVVAAPEPEAPAAAEEAISTSAAEALEEIAVEESVEIPQIDALDDIDSILDQLEDKG